MSRRLLRGLLLLGVIAVVALGLPLLLDRASAIPAGAQAADGSTEQVARGRVLALAGNCAGCHTARGGLPYAGGRVIATPFGSVVAGNLTPDEATGLGHWSADHFWRALHEGRGFDGRRTMAHIGHHLQRRPRLSQFGLQVGGKQRFVFSDQGRGVHGEGTAA